MIRTNYTRYHNSLPAMSRSRQERELARSNVLVGGFGSSVAVTRAHSSDILLSTFELVLWGSITAME